MATVEKNGQTSDVAKALGCKPEAWHRLKQYYDKYIAAFAAAKLGGTYPSCAKSPVV